MNKIKVLLIEDDRSISNFITATMDREGYKIMHALNGREGLSLSTSFCPNVILLDLGLPDMDGLEVLQKLRSWSDVPVIIISARTKEQEKVSALDLGADDYITKPFGMMEFVARVKAVLRRCARQNEERELHCKDLRVNVARHEVSYQGELKELTRKEFELLEYLLENKGLVMSRNQILCHVWGYDFDGETRTVDVHVRTLRQKLGEAGNLIETVRGVGYRIGDHL